MTIREFYDEIGGDYENILGRLPSEDLIKRFLLKFLNETSYEELMKAVEEKNVSEALSAAHKMKGVTANLSFTKLFEVLTALLAKLREENQTEIDEDLIAQIKENYEITIKAIEKL